MPCIGFFERIVVLLTSQQDIHLTAPKRNTEANNSMKCYADKRQRAKANPVTTGDTVLVRQPKLDKLSTPYDPTLPIVKERKGTMITAERGDRSKVTRNVSMFHSIQIQTDTG